MMQFEFTIYTEGSNIILLSLYCSCLCLWGLCCWRRETCYLQWNM